MILFNFLFYAKQFFDGDFVIEHPAMHSLVYVYIYCILFC